MSRDMAPLIDRERLLIKPGIEVLGNILDARASVVADVEENPEPYQMVIDHIDASLERQSDWEEPTPEELLLDTLDAVHKAMRRFMPYSLRESGRVLRDEAYRRGLRSLGRKDRIGLSNFIVTDSMTPGGGNCQQYALLSATVLRLLQIRGDIGGQVSLESRGDPTNPDRHMRTFLLGAGEQDEIYMLDTETGVRLASKSWLEYEVAVKNVSIGGLALR